MDDASRTSTARACRRSAALLALGAVMALVTAPPAGAAVIASSVSGYEGGPALAADGRVVVGERLGDGARRLLAVQPATGAVTQLAGFGGLADPATYRELTVAGTGGIVTAVMSTFHTVPKPTNPEEQASPILLETRAMTLLPRFAELGRCTPRLMTPPQLAAAAGNDFVATIGDECTSRPAVHLRTASGTIVVAARPGTSQPPYPSDVSDLRAAGPVVSWVETRLPSAASALEYTLVIARGSTGQVLARVALGRFALMLGLGSDGTALVTRTVSDFPCATNVVSPSAPALRRIELRPPFCTAWNGPVAVSGGRFVYATMDGQAVADLSGAVHALAGATGTGGIGGGAVAFDGRTAFVVRPDCDRDRLLAIDAGVTGSPPSSALVPPRRCSVRRSGSSRLRVGRRGDVRVALRCSKGCRGTLRLVQQQQRRGRERTVGTADYAAAPGGIVLRPKLAGFARRLAGCKGGLRVAAVLFSTRETRRGLGFYRIASHARCRQGREPAFRAPLPGPRP